MLSTKITVKAVYANKNNNILTAGGSYRKKLIEKCLKNENFLTRACYILCFANGTKQLPSSFWCLSDVHFSGGRSSYLGNIV